MGQLGIWLMYMPLFVAMRLAFNEALELIGASTIFKKFKRSNRIYFLTNSNLKFWYSKIVRNCKKKN